MPMPAPKTALFDRSAARVALYEALADSPIYDMATVSKKAGKNHAYLQQYLMRGTPKSLPEDVRAAVANLLKINEDLLRPPKSKTSSSRQSQDVAAHKSEQLQVPPSVSSVSGAQGIPKDGTPEIDVTAGLGGGGLSIITAREFNGGTYSAEEVRDYWRLPEWLLGHWSNAKAHHVVCFPAQGDSMSPTIESGDVVFADLRHRVPSPPGIFILADAFGGVVAKRLEVVSKPGDEPVQVKVSSDNPRHESQVWTLDEIHIVGRYLGRFTEF